MDRETHQANRRADGCFICGRLVLGLVGQDTVLDTMFLKSEEEDNQVVQESAFGPVHYSCLLRSKWVQFWSKRIYENLTEVRRMPVIAVTDGYVALSNSVLRTYFVLGEDGLSATIEGENYDRWRPVDGGWLIQVIHEHTMNLTGFENALEFVRHSFSHLGHCLIVDLVRALDLYDTLLYPVALEGGVIRPIRGRGKRVLTQAQLSFVETVADYHQFLPYAVGQAIRSQRAF